MSPQQEERFLENLMLCMIHYGDDECNPLRDRIADEFPTLAKRYPGCMVFVWVPGTNMEMIRVGVLPTDFQNGMLHAGVLRNIVWRTEMMHLWR